MPIKKRSNLPDPNATYEEQKGLNIVAKPKKPLPPLRLTANNPPPATLRALGNLALACGEAFPDASVSVADRVVMLRTPFDEKNSQEARYRNRVKNRATAITAMCIVCIGTRKGVTECLATECPLWAFRFGGDPFRGKRK